MNNPEHAQDKDDHLQHDSEEAEVWDAEDDAEPVAIEPITSLHLRGLDDADDANQSISYDDGDDSSSHRNDSDEFLVHMAKRYPALSREEERELFRVIRNPSTDPEDVENAKKAKERLIGCSLRWIIGHARTFRSSGGISDLVQEGLLGLNRAIERSDPEQGTRLVSYATHFVNGAMIDHLLDFGRAIRLPSALHKRLLALSNYLDDCARVSGLRPTVEEMCERFRCQPEEIHQWLDILNKYAIGSLTARPNDSLQEPNARSPWRDDRMDEPEMAALRSEIWDSIKRAASGLDSQEACVVMMKCEWGLTVKEIASIMGLSIAEARALLRRGYEKLRARFELRTDIRFGDGPRAALNANTAAGARGHRSAGDVAKTGLSKIMRREKRHTLIAVALSCLEENNDKLRTDEFTRETARQIDATEFEPVSDDPFESDPTELAYFLVPHLIHNGLMTAPPGEPVAITSAGNRWLAKHRKWLSKRKRK